MKVYNSLSTIHSSRRGYIATATVLLLMAVALSIMATVSLLGIGEAQSSLALTKGESNLFFVEGCMEDALLKAKNSPGYAGGTITRPEGTCVITASNAGSVWTITAVGSATDYVRKIMTVSTRSGQGMTITSWQEI